MNTTSPEIASALLRRAADRIDQLASRATPGPWRTADVEGIFYIASAAHGPVTMDNDHPVCSCRFDDTEGVAIELDESEGGRGDAEWMAAMSPVVAPPMSSWLRAEADVVDARIAPKYRAWDGAASVVESFRGPALAVARAVLGEDPS